MRAITRESVQAFLNGTPFKKSNTQVEIGIGGTVFLSYHGNIIAYKEMNSSKFIITNCGWFSNTTKERLNGLPNVRINQKDFNWFLNGQPWDGSQTLVFY
jgi:hypothetical protein